MKVRCDRNSLVESLTSIAGIIPPNSPKEILGGFYLGTAAGSLVVEASDLEISGTAVIHKVEVESDGAVALPSSRLISILKELPDEFVTVTSRDEPQGAVLESGGFQFKILGHDPGEFPKSEEPATTNSLSVAREKLHDALKRVSVAASRDTTRYQLNGVFLEFQDGKLTLTATDGKRLTHDSFRVSETDVGAISAILPNQAIDVFLKVLSGQGVQDETVTLSLSESHVTLKTKNHRVSSNLVEGMFPNYKAVMPAESAIRIKSKKAELLAAARSAALTADKQTSTVIFKVSPSSLVLESNAQDVGESRIEISVESTGDSMEVRFNPIYFIDALRTFDEDEITMELSDPSRPAVLRTSQNYKHLVMPLVNT